MMEHTPACKKGWINEEALDCPACRTDEDAQDEFASFLDELLTMPGVPTYPAPGVPVRPDWSEQ